MTAIPSRWRGPHTGFEVMTTDRAASLAGEGHEIVELPGGCRVLLDVLYFGQDEGQVLAGRDLLADVVERAQNGPILVDRPIGREVAHALRERVDKDRDAQLASNGAEEFEGTGPLRGANGDERDAGLQEADERVAALECCGHLSLTFRRRWACGLARPRRREGLHPPALPPALVGRAFGGGGGVRGLAGRMPRGTTARTSRASPVRRSGVPVLRGEEPQAAEADQRVQSPPGVDHRLCNALGISARTLHVPLKAPVDFLQAGVERVVDVAQQSLRNDRRPLERTRFQRLQDGVVPLLEFIE